MFSKLAQIALYIVVGISILVIVFFYFGDNLINTDKYEAKIEKMSAPADDFAGFDFASDLAEADSAAVESDTTAVEGEDSTAVAEAATPEITEEPVVIEEEVSLTFMEYLVFSKTDIALVWAYILVALTLIIALVFSLIFMFSNTKALVRGLLVLVGAAVLIGLAYSLGSDTPLKIIGYEGTDNSDPQVLRLVDMGLISTYFVLGLIVLSIFFSEIAKYFK